MFAQIAKKMPAIFVFAGLMFASASQPADARATGSNTKGFFTRETSNSGRDSCMADFHKFCPGQQAKNGAMGRCLGAYQGRVSPACTPVLANWCSAGYCGQ